MACREVRDIRLHENIARIKASEEVGVKFMNAWEENLLFKQEGYEEGLQKGLSTEDITDMTGLKIYEVKALQL